MDLQLTDAVDPELILVLYEQLQTLERDLMDSQDTNAQLTQTVERLRDELASAPPRKPTPGSFPTSVGDICRSSEQRCASRVAVCRLATARLLMAFKLFRPPEVLGRS